MNIIIMDANRIANAHWNQSEGAELDDFGIEDIAHCSLPLTSIQLCDFLIVSHMGQYKTLKCRGDTVPVDLVMDARDLDWIMMKITQWYSLS